MVKSKFAQHFPKFTSGSIEMHACVANWTRNLQCRIQAQIWFAKHNPKISNIRSKLKYDLLNVIQTRIEISNVRSKLKYDFLNVIQSRNTIAVDIPIGDVTKDVDISTDAALDVDAKWILVDLMML